MRWAADFCRGLTPTVWANMYRATDFCPTPISRLQRRQCMCSKDLSKAANRSSRNMNTEYEYCLRAGARCKYVEGFRRDFNLRLRLCVENQGVL